MFDILIELFNRAVFEKNAVTEIIYVLLKWEVTFHIFTSP